MHHVLIVGSQSTFQAPYQINLNKTHDSSFRITAHAGSKHSAVQQHAGLLPGTPSSLHSEVRSNAAASRLIPPHLSRSKKLKVEPSSYTPSSGLKREYDRMAGNNAYERSSQPNIHDTTAGLSPRKKPRKQTHVVAEGNQLFIMMDPADNGCEDRGIARPICLWQKHL